MFPHSCYNVFESLSDLEKNMINKLESNKINTFTQINNNIYDFIKLTTYERFKNIQDNIFYLKCLSDNNFLNFNYYTNLELVEYISIKPKLYFLLSSPYYYTNYKIKKLTCKNDIDCDLLNYHVYFNELDIYTDKNYINLNHIIGLKKLVIRTRYINDISIEKLNLVKLYICEYLYSNIKKINHMSNLKILDISSNERLNNKSLENIDLYELNISFNYNIVNLNHFKNMKILYAAYNYNLSSKSVKDINLIKLCINDNKKIKELNHMTNLKSLDISGYECGVSDDSIRNLNLVYLSARNNYKIKKIEHMTNLKVLDASGHNSRISNRSIKNLKLIVLNVCDNQNITNIDNTTIKILDASNDSLIKSEAIKKLNLIYLNIKNNQKLSDLLTNYDMKKLYRFTSKISFYF